MFLADFIHSCCSGNLIDVRNQYPILGTALGQAARNAISLKVFRYPSVLGLWQIFNDNMNDPIMETAETLTVFPVMQGFGAVGMCLGRLNQHEFVDDTVQLIEPKLQQFKFVKKSEAIVCHSKCQGPAHMTSKPRSFGKLRQAKSARTASELPAKLPCPKAGIESFLQIILNRYVKVSVLIPTYNSEKHLAECLDSVLAQDFVDMEIVVSDDRSADGTVKIIEAYAARDHRIRWWQNPKNLGFVPNHNLCLQEARAEYVKFIHADDKLLSSSAIRKMAEILDGHPSVVLVGCEQHLTGTDKTPTIFSTTSGIHEGRRMMVRCWEQNTNLIGQPTLTLFRRAAATRGFDLRFEGHLDYEMWFHLLEQGDFYYLAERQATWRIHEIQKTAALNRDGSSAS